jgi:hypothetical protein
MYFQANSSAEKGCAKARSPSCEQAKLMAKEQNRLLRSSFGYPRGKTTGYYASKNQNRRLCLTSKSQNGFVPRAKSAWNTSNY